MKKKPKNLRDRQTRVCLYVDKDTLEMIRQFANLAGKRYQPFINEILLNYVVQRNRRVSFDFENWEMPSAF